MAGYLQSYLESRKRIAAPADIQWPTLDDLRRAYISYLLDMTFHNVSQTARILNVSRTTLYNNLHRFGPVRGS